MEPLCKPSPKIKKKKKRKEKLIISQNIKSKYNPKDMQHST